VALIYTCLSIAHVLLLVLAAFTTHPEAAWALPFAIFAWGFVICAVWKDEKKNPRLNSIQLRARKRRKEK